MKILFIVPPPQGGTLQYTHCLANALSERGHEVMLATGIGFELSEYPRGYTFIEVFDRMRPRPRLMTRFLIAVRKFRPDLIHLQGAQHPELYLMICWILALIVRVRFVYTPQDVVPNKQKKHHPAAFRRLYRRMGHVFLNAEQNLKPLVDLYQVPEDRITVLPIPEYTAFLRDYYPPESSNGSPHVRNVLCLGLIEPRKGVDVLIEAFPRVLERIPNARLQIVGKSYVDISEYERRIAELGIGDSVEICPRYLSFEEVAHYFYGSAVVVLPYISGWNSGVLSSAYGFGKPVVATDVGGLREAVQEGKTGYIVPPSDSTSLADAIARVLVDDQHYAELAEQAKLAAGQHSWTSIAEQTDLDYDKVLKQAH